MPDKKCCESSPVILLGHPSSKISLSTSCKRCKKYKSNQVLHRLMAQLLPPSPHNLSNSWPLQTHPSKTHSLWLTPTRTMSTGKCPK